MLISLVQLLRGSEYPFVRLVPKVIGAQLREDVSEGISIVRRFRSFRFALRVWEERKEVSLRVCGLTLVSVAKVKSCHCLSSFLASCNVTHYSVHVWRREVGILLLLPLLRFGLIPCRGLPAPD